MDYWDKRPAKFIFIPLGILVEEMHSLPQQPLLPDLPRSERMIAVGTDIREPQHDI